MTNEEDSKHSASEEAGNKEEKFLHYKRVGHYLLGNRIGEGSFAKVYIGQHSPTGEKVKKSFVFRKVDKKLIL